MSTPFGGNGSWQQPQPNSGSWSPPSQPPSGGFPSQNNPQQHSPQSQQSFPVNFGVAGGGGNAPGSPTKNPRRTLMMVLGAVVVVLIALGVTGFWKPGFFVTKIFDVTAQQAAIKEVLTTSLGTPAVESVSCPADQKVKAGNTFQCTVKVAGQEKKVTITVKDSDGNYEVSSVK